MIARIALITILTDNVPQMAAFYRELLGFYIKTDLGNYIEFESEGVRFAICAREVLADSTGHPSYHLSCTGQKFELAFPQETPGQVDAAYADLIKRGAAAVKAPANMPWNQRAAFFADPDGNIHEIFAELN
jgi:catechol 2,3-dioxygenase-like lactoylglutathione lyase family enzyme